MYLIKIFIGLMVIFIFTAYGNNCENTEWFKEGIRSQGGGWIWFRGEWLSIKKDTAYSMAEGMALDRLIKECMGIHSLVKFIERCDHFKDGHYTAFARASIKIDDCNQGKTSKKFENPVLKKVWEDYLKNSSKIEGCSDGNFSNCHIISELKWGDGSRKDAMKIAEDGCLHSNSLACVSVSKYKFLLDNKPSIDHIQIACREVGKEKCNEIGLIHMSTQDTLELGIAYLSFLCKSLSSLKSCNDLAYYFLEAKNLKESNSYFLHACKYGSDKACNKLGIKPIDSDNSDNSEKFINDITDGSIRPLEI